MIPLEVVLIRPGATPLRLTPSLESFRWSTAAVGGFSAASFAVPGDPAHWRRDIPHLALARVVLDTQVIWEGQVEDITVKLLDGQTAASVTCFGLQRRLAETSVRRIWSKRDLVYQQRPAFQVIPDPAFDSATGNLLPDDLTKSGIAFTGNGGTTAFFSTGKRTQWWVNAAAGLSFQRAMFTYDKGGNANLNVSIRSTTDYSTIGQNMSNATNGTGLLGDIPLTTNAVAAMFEAEILTADFATSNADFIRFYNIRLLGTSLTEDATGGFYGGTILRDLLALVPDLTIGVIDQGSDYTIQAIERSVRSAALDAVKEVAGYYTREWAVWEDGRFDWKTVNKDEPQWVVRLAELNDGSELTFSVDGIARTLYVLYGDAASGLDAEQSSASTAQRNPYTKQGKTKDLLASPGFPMTSSSASQLASKLVGDSGNYVPVTGRLILSAQQPVRRATGSQLPALMIRGGDNITVADLPKSDLYATGRDGETLFHIVSTEADLASGTVTLEVEGQTNRADVLLARLAASTRILTG